MYARSPGRWDARIRGTTAWVAEAPAAVPHVTGPLLPLVSDLLALAGRHTLRGALAAGLSEIRPSVHLSRCDDCASPVLTHSAEKEHLSHQKSRRAAGSWATDPTWLDADHTTSRVLGAGAA